MPRRVLLLLAALVALGNTCSTRVPRGFAHPTFGQAQSHFGQTYGATVLAVHGADGLVVSPPWDRPVDEGDTLYYVARERIDESRLAVRR